MHDKNIIKGLKDIMLINTLSITNNNMQREV